MVESVPAAEVGADVYITVPWTHYTFCGKIDESNGTSISSIKVKDLTTNYYSSKTGVTYDYLLNADEVMAIYGTQSYEETFNEKADEYDYMVCIPSQPTWGECPVTRAGFASGYANSVSGDYGFAEGTGNVIGGAYGHAEGLKNQSAYGAHAEGGWNKAHGMYAHAEGESTIAEGKGSHTEGGYFTNDEGVTLYTHAIGQYSHAEGMGTLTDAEAAHAEGKGCQALAKSSHAEGRNTTASAQYAHAEGRESESAGNASHSEGEYTHATASCAHAEGWQTYAQGKHSHSEGRETHATAENSHAEGYNTYAKGSPSHAEGHSTHAEGQCSHAEGYDTYAKEYSHAEGHSTHAEGQCSHAEGYGVYATAENSHAEGYHTYAKGMYSHAEGHSTETQNNCSHAEGSSTKAFGGASHTEGWKTSTTEKAPHAHAEGEGTVANARSQHVQGRWNEIDTDTTTIFGEFAHIVGNGWADLPDGTSQRSNAHTVDWNGKGSFAAEVASNGADYAEFFEWQDGNPDNEDRVGYLVALDGEKIKFANQGDEILGIISGTPAVLGDNYEWQWNGKYLTDDFGRIIYEETEEFDEVIVGNDEEGNPIIEKQSLGFFKHPKLNPDYDPEQTYVNRANRPEWSTVGMLGKLYVRDNGTCLVNGYATVSNQGIATYSVEKTNMRVLSRVNDNVRRVLLK